MVHKVPLFHIIHIDFNEYIKRIHSLNHTSLLLKEVHLNILVINENDQPILYCVIVCQSSLINTFYIKHFLGPYSKYKCII